jgi:hypothetical protein
MYGIDSLPPSYYEERLAADHASRLAARQSAHLAAQARRLEEQKAHLATCPSQKSSMPCPQNLTQALLQRPALSHSGSNGIMGGIFQGFVRAKEGRSGTSTPKETSPVTTPGASTDGRLTREEYDAWCKGRKREEAMPAFYY